MNAKHPRENPIHYPEDRRLYIVIMSPIIVIAVVLFLVPLALAWTQYALQGLHEVAVTPLGPAPTTDGGALNFPGWVEGHTLF